MLRQARTQLVGGLVSVRACTSDVCLRSAKILNLYVGEQEQ